MEVTVNRSSQSNLLFRLDAAPVFTDLPKVIEVQENNQRGQIIRNIYGQARSRWNQNASIKYTIIQGKLVINKISVIAGNVLSR